MKDRMPMEVDGTIVWFCIFSLVIIELVVLAIIFGRPELIGSEGFRWDIGIFYPKAGIEGVKDQLARPDPRTSNDYNVADKSATTEITPIGDIIAQAGCEVIEYPSWSEDESSFRILIERLKPFSSESNCKYHVTTTEFVKYDNVNATVLNLNRTHVECDIQFIN